MPQSELMSYKETEAGKNELHHVISCVLARRLSSYRRTIDDRGREVLLRGPPPAILNSHKLAMGVEGLTTDLGSATHSRDDFLDGPPEGPRGTGGLET